MCAAFAYRYDVVDFHWSISRVALGAFGVGADRFEQSGRDVARIL